jgi:cell division protein FtsW (lipid II flippase)
LVLVPGIGTEIQGGRRWFDLGIVTLQPSEFAKLTTMLALAAFVSSRADGLKELGNFLLSLGIVCLPMVLVMAEPDFDSALMFGIIWVAMMFVSRPRFAYIVALVAAAPLILFLTYTFFLREFHRVRIQAFLGLVEDPLGVSYQPMQAKISIGSGGMFGFGLRVARSASSTSWGSVRATSCSPTRAPCSGLSAWSPCWPASLSSCSGCSASRRSAAIRSVNAWRRASRRFSSSRPSSTSA